MNPQQKDIQQKIINTVRVPIPLIPVYVVLLLQFAGVCVMAGVLWTKLEYHTLALEKIERKMSDIFKDGLDDRYRGKDAERDVQKIYGSIGAVAKDIKEVGKQLESLEFRVRHFQAQFPRKERLP